MAVSIGTTITNRSLEPKIRSILDPSIAALLLERTETLSMLSGDVLVRVRGEFGTSYNKQMYLAVGLAAACLPVAAMAWTTTPVANARPTPEDAEKSAIMDYSVGGPSSAVAETGSSGSRT